jgi:hypothetical protein
MDTEPWPPPVSEKSSRALASTTYRPSGETDPASPEWQRYYANASRRRRAIRRRIGRVRTPAEERKRRRLVETALMLGSMVLLGALTAIFHSVLTR